MPSFGRWQIAGREHLCDGCKKTVHEKEMYLRLGYVPKHEWGLLVGDRTLTEDLLRRLFDVAARKRLPIRAWHASCWLAHPQAQVTPRGASEAALSASTSTAR
jgi:hypothetical protein